MMHICNRHQTHADKDRMHMKSNALKLKSIFETFDQRVRPITSRIRKMLGAKLLAPVDKQPSQEQIDAVMDEFSERILPMFNQQLDGKNYFIGDDMTGYDLLVYCEIKSIRVFAEKLVNERLSAYPNVTNWMERINIIPEVAEIEGHHDAEAMDTISHVGTLN